MKSSTKILAVAIVILFASCTKEQPQSLVPKTVDQDPTLPAITVNGAMLHSEAFGHPDSTIIVCLHGGPGGDYRYLLSCKDLAGYGYRVVFYDQRGSGLSQRFSKKSYTDAGLGALDMLYSELSGVIAHYKTHPDQKVVLLGHSWGAILATAYAGRHPSEIDGLIVCEPGGLKWNDIKDYVFDSRSFKIWGEAFNDATFLEQFMTGKEDQHDILDYKMAMLASKNEVTGDDNTLPGSFWRSGAVINTGLFEVGKDFKPDFSAGINNFTHPVLFFYSEKNKAYTDSWAQRISAAYPSVQLVKVAGVGHDGIITVKSAWMQTTLPQSLDYLKSI